MNAPVNPNKALWEKGDFTRIAETMRESGEALVQRLGITKDMQVLDLGCGDGTTALPEAKLGADVLGIDIARNLVEAGNRRAAEQGLTNIKFQEGDASNLRQVFRRRTFRSPETRSLSTSRIHHQRIWMNSGNIMARP